MNRLVKGYYLGITSWITSIATPRPLQWSPHGEQAISPIGLYIIAARQGIDVNFQDPETFIVNTVAGPLISMLQNQALETFSLQSSVRRDEVFKKPLLSFYINEKKIAQAAAFRQYRSALIVYYSYTGGSATLDSGAKVYECFSLYGWLVSTVTGKIIASSHHRLRSYVSYMREKHPDLHQGSSIAGDAAVTGELYKEFLLAQTREMFGAVKEKKKQMNL